MADRIFVQIPAYRDRELVATVSNLYQQARHPERLRVAIAWQYAEEELCHERELEQWPNLTLLKVPASESRGCNWARSRLQQLWDGERYTLFLDSHHRFVPEWDVHALSLLDGLRSASDKPVLTGYLPPYDPRRDPQGRASSIYRVRPVERHQGLLFRLVGDPVTAPETLTAPMRARFVSLHFLLADGRFNQEVPVDASIYFFADEIAMALRAHTHGYDLFHPHRVLGWHLYDRASRVPHWRDHADWRARNVASCQQLRALYRGELRGRFGVGPVRSVADYESLIGQPLIEGGGQA